MKEPLVIHNFVKTGDGYGVDMRDWLEEELDRIWTAVCPYDSCRIDPFANMRAGIAVLQGLIAAQQIQIDDLLTRVDALENP